MLQEIRKIIENKMLDGITLLGVCWVASILRSIYDDFNREGQEKLGYVGMNSVS